MLPRHDTPTLLRFVSRFVELFLAELDWLMREYPEQREELLRQVEHDLTEAVRRRREGVS